MSLALRLFKINFQNNYYTQDADNDFYIIPNQQTYQFMEEHKMRLMFYRRNFELIWRTMNFEDPIKVFEQKIADQNFCFYLQIKNTNLINFSFINIDLEHIYYFTNTADSEKLHKKEYVSEEDKIPLQNMATIVDSSAKNVFGIINIQLDKLWKNKINIGQLPIEYTLQIKARETIWRYHIIDLHNHIKDHAKVVIDKDDSYFIYKGNIKNQHIHLYESKQPIMLKDKVTETFSLKTYSAKPAKKVTEKIYKKVVNTDQAQEEVLVERLPIPDVGSLENNLEKGGIPYSNIVVYV